jgi:hypothetical protein
VLMSESMLRKRLGLAELSCAWKSTSFSAKEAAGSMFLQSCGRGVSRPRQAPECRECESIGTGSRGKLRAFFVKNPWTTYILRSG